MNSSPAILIMIHCRENTGYAITSLEEVFLQAALSSGFTKDSIFWSFNGLVDQQAPNKIDCNFQNPNAEALVPFIKNNNIKTVLAFDLGYPAPVLKILKESGVSHVISYWGAGMSSINSGLKLIFKKLEYFLRRDKPNIFVFESEAMRKTATHGRGIPTTATEVIYLGVDTKKFSPPAAPDYYAHTQFNIPQNRRIIFYSGHMEERKGVRIIIKAALIMAAQNQLDNVHFILCGNKGDEAKTYTDMLIGSGAITHVTFAGYRNDIPQLMRSSSIGVIASTGWDSFTLSSVEMMASGLPLIVSNLQGLAETIEHEHNGYLIEPGNAEELALRIYELINNPILINTLADNSRKRALKKFTKEQQVQKIAALLRQR